MHVIGTKYHLYDSDGKPVPENDDIRVEKKFNEILEEV
jgi:hypothetical protein